jgi:hypothetical protein
MGKQLANEAANELISDCGSSSRSRSADEYGILNATDHKRYLENRKRLEIPQKGIGRAEVVIITLGVVALQSPRI